MQSKIMFALPREIMDLQLSAVDLLTAMYPSPTELSIPSSEKILISQLQQWCEDEKALPSTVPEILSLSLSVSIPSSSSDDTTSTEEQRQIQLNISVPLQSPDPEPLEAPAWRWGIRQPEWLSKAQVASLSAAMPAEDIFSAIDYLRDESPLLLSKVSSSTTITSSSSAAGGNGSEGRLVRVWFYFPSLSTREKRDDLVNNAPHYSLTGFVLAGKPGVLCLEGTSKDVDEYMKFIKTESWGDIPSHQKKVSEKYREEGDEGDEGDEGKGVQRRFVGMREITDSLGERRGERANRGDMRALEGWLKEMGLGKAFEKVIM